MIQEFKTYKDIPLTKLISFSNLKPYENVDKTKGNTSMALYTFYYKTDTLPIVNKINLFYNCNSFTNVTNNDSMINVYFKMNSLLVRLNMTDSNDINILPPDDIKYLPMDLAFIKRGDKLFLLLMSNTKKQGVIDPFILKNILKGN